MNERIDILGGLDIGNGYVKGKLVINDGDPFMVDMPSCVSYIPNTAWVPVEPDNAYMDNIYNELDCEITSAAINPSDRGRLLFGKRAVDSGNTPVIFNIDDHTPKCEDSLSAELVLGVLAGVALRDYWQRNHELPSSKIEVHMRMGIALPISDYMEYRETYRHKFMAGVHTVHVHNFERDVTVDIFFDAVTVLAEGTAAQYAITDLGPAFLDAVLADCRASGFMIDPEETGETLVNYRNVIGIDIGEGTVNFPVFRDGKPSIETSSSINKGYGTVLSKVVAQVRNASFAPQSRKDLAEFMLKANPNGRDRRLQARLKEHIDAEVAVFARDVIMEYKSVLNKTKLNVDVVYVYGGGANPVRDALYPMLIEASKLDEDIYTPVVYLNSDYSRDLNRNGLYMVAKMVKENEK